MMWKHIPYTIVTHHQAASFLDRLEKSQPRIHRQIDIALYALALFKTFKGIKAMKGTYRGYQRIRVGKNYRVIFRFDHHAGKLYVVEIDHRKDIYRP